MYWLRSKFGRFWPLILIAAMLTVFIVFATKQDNLNVYNGGNSTYTVESESETEKEVVSNTYMNKDIDLSMQIPDGWQHVTKDGYDTYVHSASASSIQIQVMAYYPMVNNATAESLSETYSQRGMEITEFQYMSYNSYYLIYQSQGMSGITDYIEYVIWDRSHVAKVVVTFNDENYEKLKDEIWHCLDSISWQYEDPITDGYRLVYQLDGDFEYAVPDQWTTGSSDSSFYAYDESSGASLTVNLINDPTMLSDITELDYSNFLSNGKSNFALNQFQQSDNSIYGEATYVNNDVQMAIVQEYFANGTYQYILTYEFPTELGSDYVSLAQNGLGMTRIFYTADESESETDETNDTQTESNGSSGVSHSDTNGTVFTPGSLPSEQSESQSETQVAGQSEATQSETQSGSQNENVSSFSDALQSVANLSQTQADNVSYIWSSLNLGTPTYAQAVKESDTSLILMVTNDQNINFYITVGKDGTLQEIHAESEDGQLIYPQS